MQVFAVLCGALAAWRDSPDGDRTGWLAPLGDLEGDAGITRLVLLGEGRHELRAKGVGPLDHELLSGGDRRDDEGRGEAELDFHRWNRWELRMLV